MATARIIQCADCQYPRQTNRRNTKYCKVCRLYRDLFHLAGRKAKCLVCQEPFVCLDRNDRLCAKCDHTTVNNERGRCAICSEENALLIKAGVAICTSCAKDPNPKTMKLVMRGVVAKRTKQIKTPAPELELQAAEMAQALIPEV